MDENLEIADQIITKWDLENSRTFTRISSLFSDDRTEAREFLRSVQGLQAAMHFLIEEGSRSEKLFRAQSLMQVAVKRLEREFYQILSKHQRGLDPESVSVSSHSSRSSSPSGDASEEDSCPAGDLAMLDLKSIADVMTEIGYGKECAKIYKLMRKSIVDKSLYNLGVLEQLSSSQIQKMDWETIDSKIKVWLKAVKIAVNTIFHREKILCDHVFSSSATIGESCFATIANGSGFNLFRFPENIANCKKLTPEKMFTILDIYNALSELIQEIEFIFSYSATSSAKLQAITSMQRLGEAVRVMLVDFEAAIQKESSKLPLPGGGIHPLTRYVMNYLVFLSDYDRAITDIIEDWPLTVNSPLPESYFPANEGQLPAISTRFAWIILVLLCKLDSKAELYRDVSLSYLFLVNNLNYVVSKVRSSNIRFILSDDWVNRHVEKVKQYASNYERMGWSKVMSSLDRTTSVLPQECFRRFNSAFEEVCRKQATWVVPETDLRAEIKSSLVDKVVPVYRRFYGEFREMLRGVTGEEGIVRFAPEDVEKRVEELFNAPVGSRGSDTSSSCGASR